MNGIKRQYRRIVAFLLVLLMLIPSLPALAASGSSISVGTVTGKPGDQVSVTVSVSANPGIAYLKLKIGYDSTQLTLTNAKNSGLLTGTFTTSKTTNTNPYVLQWMGAENSNGNGTVATLTFQIASNATGGDKAISVTVDECYNETFNDITLSSSNGKVTVNTYSPKTLKSISVNSNPTKTSYYIGDTFSSSGLKIKATYSDGTTEILNSGFSVSTPDMTTGGTKSVTVTYNGKTTTFTVTVNAPSIKLSNSRKTINAGSSFTLIPTTNPSGASVSWSSSDSSVATVSNGTVNGLKAGNATITAYFTYNGIKYSATCDVNVSSTTKTLSSISIYSAPAKTEYYIGDKFDTSGLKINVKYTDNTSEIISSGYTISGFNSDLYDEAFDLEMFYEPHKESITVSYGGKSTSTDVYIVYPQFEICNENGEAIYEDVIYREYDDMYYYYAMLDGEYYEDVAWELSNDRVVRMACDRGVAGVRSSKPGVVYLDLTATLNNYEYYTSVKIQVDINSNYLGRFLDINKNAWYVKYVNYCYYSGYMNGTGANAFSPNAPLTRAMFVTILAAVDGVDKSNLSGYTGFKDVPANSWYSKNVQWAVQTGIVSGTGGNNFSPNSYVTREQMALMLKKYYDWRYDVIYGENVNDYYIDLVNEFGDASSVSSWAKVAMGWAISEGIIAGSNNRLMPRGNATRAQTATMIRGFDINLCY